MPPRVDEAPQTGAQTLEAPPPGAGARLFGGRPDDVLEAVGRAYWIADGRFPVPRWDVRCPADPRPLGSGRPRDGRDPHLKAPGPRVQLSRIHYGRRKQSRHARADLVFKCCDCSLAWTHGVPIPREVHDRAIEDHGNTWQWREVREEMREAGLLPAGDTPEEGS